MVGGGTPTTRAKFNAVFQNLWLYFFIVVGGGTPSTRAKFMAVFFLVVGGGTPSTRGKFMAVFQNSWLYFPSGWWRNTKHTGGVFLIVVGFGMPTTWAAHEQHPSLGSNIKLL